MSGSQKSSVAQQSLPGYEGPCSVTVAVREWRSFYEHAPSWWPRTFAEPTRELVGRVSQRLRERLV